jgi:hypothetical protein
LLIKCLHIIFQAAIDHQTQLLSTTAQMNFSSSSSSHSSGAYHNPAAASTNSERKAKLVPIYPLLIYYLMPQVKSLLYNYTSDICKEISSQVKELFPCLLRNFLFEVIIRLFPF